MQSCLILTALYAVSLVGCVQPTPVDKNVLNEYQSRIVQRGRQERPTEGLGLLRPSIRTAGPALKTEKDSETGKTIVKLSLKDAVLRALANNLDIRVVSYDPEISRAETIAAAAAFDYVVFAGASFEDSDDPQNSTTQGNIRTKTHSLSAGVKNKTVTGADVSLAYTMDRTWSSSVITRDQSVYEPSMTLTVTQPLLKGAWPKVNLATLHIAQINRKISEAAFRQRVEEVVTEVVSTYWKLVQARRELEIHEELLAKTIETKRRVEERLGFDATAVQAKQTESAVETRRAIVIRSKKTILDVQDQLARLLADGQIYLLDDYEMILTSQAQQELVKIDQSDQMLTALENNPRLVQARRLVDSEDIDIIVAENELLPQLDVTASAGLKGMDDDFGASQDNAYKSRYFNWSVGAVLTYPLGNRQAKANLSKARLERLKAITQLRNLAIQVGERVKERVREIETTYRELQAQGAAVLAAEVQLKALEDTEQIRPSLSPEFLQVKLQAQETLASAQRSQLQALIEYNNALITLSRATGTVLKLYGVEMVQQSRLGQKK